MRDTENTKKRREPNRASFFMSKKTVIVSRFFGGIPAPPCPSRATRTRRRGRNSGTGLRFPLVETFHETSLQCALAGARLYNTSINFFETNIRNHISHSKKRTIVHDKVGVIVIKFYIMRLGTVLFHIVVIKNKKLFGTFVRIGCCV